MTILRTAHEVLIDDLDSGAFDEQDWSAEDEAFLQFLNDWIDAVPEGV